MMQEVQKAFEEQRKINFMLAKDKSYEVDGYSGFVFTAKSGRPLMPYGVNSVLYNIVDAYNKAEVQKGKERTQESRTASKGFSSCYATHSLHENGRVPYGH
ncbi:hypothetical protein [Thomasclavelia spiroformis]|uniref:hypothetical protein n=1 Tax=Thomasclavelia spiroformis TaxID=29348 RepID=UPI0029436F8B|nr:hypothetical protein [Thomasclavelia spiroformis]